MSLIPSIVSTNFQVVESVLIRSV